MLHAVIMAGGSGTRFWPASRTSHPKQLLDVLGDRSMLQSTVARLETLVPLERVLIVTNQSLCQAIFQQLPQLPQAGVLGEPCKRDTAPCIGLAALQVSQSDDDATMLVMPADHVIRPVEKFQQAIRFAAQLVEERPSRLVTFGIRPTYPAESFGYIERGEPFQDRSGKPSEMAAFEVQQFREKPDSETARQYLEAGKFYWNSGIFVWKAGQIMHEISSHEPEMYARLETIGKAFDSRDFGSVLEQEFTAIEGKSIDYAVMERAEEVVVVEAPFEWDDVGSWQAIARLNGADVNGNTVIGLHVGINTQDSIVRTDSEHLVVTLGLQDCIVVHTPDATLVANKHEEEAVREVVKLLDEKNWHQFL